MYSGGVICFSVNSGSNGNSIYVEAGDVRLLFDAGLSGERTLERLALRGRDVRAITAVIISHEHRDHVCGTGVLARKFGLPVYITAATYAGAGEVNLGRIDRLHFFDRRRPLVFGDVTVTPHATPHDAAEPAVFAVEHAGSRLGVLTDLGCVFAGLPELLGGLDGVYIESNYDPDMLECGPYPPPLKRRIRSEHGHLSNQEAAELVCRHAGGRLQWVCLSHLSETNNTPELAVGTHAAIVGRRRPIHLAPRYEVGPVLRVE